MELILVIIRVVELSRIIPLKLFECILLLIEFANFKVLNTIAY